MTEKKMELTDWLDDLCVRFIINLPQEDLSSVARICFQVEEAQWYYEDFIRPLDPTLPSMSLRTFCMRIFQHCPLLSNFSATDHMGAFEEFLLYKTRVPVRGAIMLNEAMDSVLLVKGYKKGANWSFPRGKINKDEDDLDCAIREVYEETGYDIRAAGLVPENEQVKYIEMEMREQHMRLYVFRNVPMDTFFEPRTRKEISKIMWWKLSDLPAFKKKNKGHHPEAGAQVATNANKFYMVAPFLRPLKTWVLDQKKKDGQRTASGSYLTPSNLPVDDTLTEEEPTSHGSGGAFFTEDPSPFQYPVDNGASAHADTMAETTAALKLLLKIQPATQGIQSHMSSPLERSKANKGADLLALLRGKAEAPEPPKTTVLPHTPLDLTFESAAMPRTPQHQPPPHRDLSSLAPPPSFSMPPASTMYHSVPSKMHSQHMSMAGSSHDQYLVHPQTHMKETRNHLQQLRHPQPLPPQVQKNLFTDVMGHTPAVAQFPSQKSAQNHGDRIPMGIVNPHFPHGPMVTEPKPVPQILSEHKLNLLNAFKTKEKEVGPSAHPTPASDLPLRTYSQDTIKPSDVRVPPLAVPDNGRGALSPPSGNNFAAPTILSARAPPTEAHKSSLLSIFRQPSGMSTTTTPTASIFNQPSEMPGTSAHNASIFNQPREMPATSAHNASIFKQQSEMPRTSAHRENFMAKPVAQNLPVSHAHPTERYSNPLNQQFKNRPAENFSHIMPPMSAHPRSSDSATRESNFGQSQPATSRHGQNPYSATREFTSSQVKTSSPRQKPDRQNGNFGDTNAQSKFVLPTGTQPQILKRPKNSPISQHSAMPTPVQPIPLGVRSGPEASNPATSSPLETRRPSHSTEHKSSLLALLSKKTSNNPPSLFNSSSAAGAQSGQAQADLPRQRVGGLGNDTTRRGSQTPMSPADQGFLLDYLAGEVAKTHGR